MRSINWLSCPVEAAVSSALRLLAQRKNSLRIKPRLRRMVQCVRRREDDHRAAGPADAPLSHRRDRHDSIRFNKSTAEAKKRIKAREQARKGGKQDPPQDAI